MQTFEYNSNPARVLFGQRSIYTLPREVQRLHVNAPFIIASARQNHIVAELCSILKASSASIAAVYTGATMHTPSHITDEALTLLQLSNADSVISIGGGSTVGLGKALSDRTGLPHICIPTTYSGSEMTPILGETHEGRKTTRSDPKLLPATVIYDPNLTMDLPFHLTATSGINAIAHAVEALYAPNTDPVITLLALDGIKSLAESLPVLSQDLKSVSARQQAQYGAWLCGMCLGSSGMGLHHKLCHTLGGTFNLPHAETHTVVLPHALAYNAPKIPRVMSQLAEVFPHSDGDAIVGLNLLLDKLNVPRALSALGMAEQDLSAATEMACASQYPNPRPLEEKKIGELLRRCWSGVSAKVDL